MTDINVVVEPSAVTTQVPSSGTASGGAVFSVNGQTGDVVLTYTNVGAAAASHSHAQSDVTGLTNALAGKAASVHAHAQSDVTGLADALAGKAASVHTHAQSDVTGLATALSGKVDKVSGKGLSTEDYTSEEKTKLAGVETGAQVNPAAYLTNAAVSTVEEVSVLTITKQDGSTVTFTGSGGGGSSTWIELIGKPFESIQANGGLAVASDALYVDTDSTAVSGSTKPITSGAVYTLLGDVEALLASI